MKHRELGKLSIALGLLVAFGIFHFGAKPVYLQQSDIQDFVVIESQNKTQTSLNISGSVPKEIFSAFHVETIEQSGCLVIRVKSSLNKKQNHSYWNYEYAIPSDVNRVCFGDAAHVIWRQDAGVL